MSFQFFRRFFYEIHLWLGIVSGIIVFLICLSGSVLVFREEVAHFLEPARYYVDVPPGASKLPIDDIITKLEADNPTMKVTSVTIPDKPNRTTSIMLAPPMPQGMGAGGMQGAPGGTGERGERPQGERPQGGRVQGERSQGERPSGSGERRRGEGRENREGGIRGGGGPQEGGRTQQREGQRSEGQRREGQRGEGQRGEGQGREQNPSGGPQQRGQGGPGGQQGGQGGGPGGRRGFGKMFYLNPYTGEVVGEGMGSAADPFFMSMMRLHRNLWISYRLESLGPRATLGGLIVGIATIVFVVTLLSGFVLWLPRTWQSFKKWRAWKPGFKVRFRKGVWPLVYDLHNTAGFYMLIPILILSLTGLCWSFGWYRNAASYVLGDQIFKQRMQRPEKIEPVPEPTDGGTLKPLSVGEMIERQNKLTPGRGDIVVSVPNDKETAMVIQKGRTGFFALAFKDKTQWDRFRGTVVPVEHFGQTVEVERFTDKPFGAKIAVAVRSLHFGDVTGTSSKIVFFIACLFATSFPVTGVTLWIKKLRAKSRKKRAVLPAQQTSESDNNPGVAAA